MVDLSNNFYYAFEDVSQVTYDRVQPYLFKANLVNETDRGSIDFMKNGNKKIKVEFYGLR